jgi:hypothetical protein
VNCYLFCIAVCAAVRAFFHAAPLFRLGRYNVEATTVAREPIQSRGGRSRQDKDVLARSFGFALVFPLWLLFLGSYPLGEVLRACFTVPTLVDLMVNLAFDEQLGELTTLGLRFHCHRQCLIGDKRPSIRAMRRKALAHVVDDWASSFHRGPKFMNRTKGGCQNLDLKPKHPCPPLWG